MINPSMILRAMKAYSLLADDGPWIVVDQEMISFDGNINPALLARCLNQVIEEDQTKRSNEEMDAIVKQLREDGL